MDYRQVFEAIPCSLSVIGRDFKILDANDRYRIRFGDWEGRYCYQVFRQRSEPCEVCPVGQSFKDG